MPRRPRDTAAGYFHVFTHSVWAAPALFRDYVDRLAFLRELARAVDKAGWTCLAFCLMTTHYHLLLEVDDGALPIGMHSLNFRFAVGFNARHRARGHVHGSRYGARRLLGESAVLGGFRYVVRNPFEASMCATPADWPWSSYPGTIGLAEPSSFVDATKIIGCFPGAPEVSMAQLRRFVEHT
jgi:putative transposase